MSSVPRRPLPKAAGAPPRCLAALALCGLLSACAFVPVIDAQAVHPGDCQFHTPRWKLGTHDLRPDSSCQSTRNEDAMACLAVYGVVIPAGSLVVSGSIVLAGNTLHWLEYHGTCSESLVQRKLTAFRRTLREAP